MNTRQRARGLLLAALVVELAVACGSAVADAPDASLPATVDAAADVVTVAPEVPDVASLGADACAPAPIRTPPTAWGSLKPRGACPREFAEYTVRCDFGDPAVPLEDCTQLRARPEAAACAACIYGEDGIGEGGYETPIVVHKGMAYLNVAACLAVGVNDASLSGCVGDWYGNDSCVAYACERCAASGPNDYETCKTLAHATLPCSAHVVSAKCAVAADDAGCAVGYDFLAAAQRYAVRFCFDPDAGDAAAD